MKAMYRRGDILARIISEMFAHADLGDHSADALLVIVDLVFRGLHFTKRSVDSRLIGDRLPLLFL